MKNVLICGLGAVGLTYAVKWKKHPDKCNLKILVDKKRFERYSVQKPVFNGEILEFDYILPDGRDFSADLIIIATKFQGLESAVNNIKNFVNTGYVDIPENIIKKYTIDGWIENFINFK